MEQVRIACLNEENSAGFYSLAAEYLPGSSPEKMKERAEMFPEAFIALELNGEVIGVCFGWKRNLGAAEDDSFVLDGIAVKSDFQKKGYGKMLLNAFEKAAVGYRCSMLSVGSAGGYVEKFYMDCGFVPKEYKVWKNGSPTVEKVFESTADYFSYERKNADGFVVMEKSIFKSFLNAAFVKIASAPLSDTFDSFGGGENAEHK